MLVQVLSKPYIDNMPGLKAFQSISKLIGDVYFMITEMDWTLEKFTPLLQKIISMSAEIDILRPILQDYRGMSTILGESTIST